MKLITFQSMDALEYLINHGELICDEKYIDLSKTSHTYQWVIQKMSRLIPNTSTAKYPLWCWVKCFNHICPAKHKGERVPGFDVKITFHKPEKDVFITDFRRYSFLLNNVYIPNTLYEKELFDKKLNQLGITREELRMYTQPDLCTSHRTDAAYLNICKEIQETFERCITKDSDILQGCIWNIRLSEVEKIEIIPDNGFVYGSLNYKRSDGTRMNWQDDYYKKLQNK